MEIRVVTMEDLRQLKMELIEEMKEIFNLKMKNSNERLWLKSAEVRQLLNVTPDRRKPILSQERYRYHV